MEDITRSGKFDSRMAGQTYYNFEDVCTTSLCRRGQVYDVGMDDYVLYICSEWAAMRTTCTIVRLLSERRLEGPLRLLARHCCAAWRCGRLSGRVKWRDRGRCAILRTEWVTQAGDGVRWFQGCLMTSTADTAEDTCMCLCASCVSGVVFHRAPHSGPIFLYPIYLIVVCKTDTSQCIGTCNHCSCRALGNSYTDS